VGAAKNAGEEQSAHSLYRLVPVRHAQKHMHTPKPTTTTTTTLTSHSHSLSLVRFIGKPRNDDDFIAIDFANPDLGTFNSPFFALSYLLSRFLVPRQNLFCFAMDARTTSLLFLSQVTLTLA
jgi:hypothetical protein